MISTTYPDNAYAPDQPVEPGGDWWRSNAPPPPPEARLGGTPSTVATAMQQGGITGYGAGSTGHPQDREFVKAQITRHLLSLGIQPSGRGTGNGDVEYWTDRAMQTGGWTPDNAGYWTNRISQEVSGHSPEAGFTGFAGFGGGSPTGFGAPPPPFQMPAVPSTLQSPYTAATYTPGTFTPPTGLDATTDPGYQERLKAANLGLERSAAAHGTILSGGFQQALGEYNQNYASNEYGNVYNRALQGFQTNEGNRFGAFQANTGNQLNARQQNLGEFQTSVGNAMNQYTTNYNIGRNAQTDYWSRLFGLGQLGLQASLGSRVG